VAPGHKFSMFCKVTGLTVPPTTLHGAHDAWSPPALGPRLAVALPAPLLAPDAGRRVPESTTFKQEKPLGACSPPVLRSTRCSASPVPDDTAVVEDPNGIYPGEVLRLKSDVALDERGRRKPDAVQSRSDPRTRSRPHRQPPPPAAATPPP